MDAKLGLVPLVGFAGALLIRHWMQRKTTFDVTSVEHVETNAVDAKFCSACGAARADGSRFCDQCGKDLALAHNAQSQSGKLDKHQKHFLFTLSALLIFLFIPNASIGAALSGKTIKYVSAIEDPVGWLVLISIFANMYCVYIRNYFASILLSAFAGICFLLEAFAIIFLASDPPSFSIITPQYPVLFGPVVGAVILVYRANKLRIPKR